MAEKERKQQQEKFAPKYCKIMTERYLITVIYYSKAWQSVTVYERDGETVEYKFHATFSIDINTELEPYSFYVKSKNIEDGILQITSFTYYIYNTVYDAIKWLELWKEVDMEEEDKEVAKLFNQFYETGEMDSELKESVVKKVKNQIEEDEDNERYERVKKALMQLIADGNVGKKSIFDYLKEM